MDDIIAKIRVISKAAVTLLTLIMGLLVTLSEQIAEVFPGDTGENIGMWLIRAVAWLGAAIAIIRRVSPVEADQRGILPVSTP